MGLLLGVDLGASDLKLNAVCAKSLAVVASGRHAIATNHPQPNWAEQNPRDWELALIHAISELSHQIDFSQLIGMSITAGAHIPVLLDDKQQPLRPALLWSDQRSAESAAILAEHAGFIEQSLNQPNATWTAAMLHWLGQNEPTIMQRCKHILPAKDYLRFLLSDQQLTDPSDAIGFLLADNLGYSWSSELCDLVGIRPEQLPPIEDSLNPCTAVSERAAHRFGLPSGLPIATGGIDTSVELLSNTTAGQTQTVIKLASAGVIYQTTQRPIPQPPVSLYPSALPREYYYAAGMNSCATSLRWMTNILLGGHLETRKIFDLARESVPGANGVVTLPYLMGERAPIWNADVKAMTLGMTQVTSRADLAQSMVEGVCFALKNVTESMRLDAVTNTDTNTETSTTSSPMNNAPITVIGGGAKSALWTQTLANILGQPLAISRHSDAAYGAALVAGLALERLAPSAIHAANQPTRVVFPDAATQALYAKQWRTYQQAQALAIQQTPSSLSL